MQNMLLAPSGVGLTLCLFESAAPTLKPALRALPLCFPILFETSLISIQVLVSRLSNLHTIPKLTITITRLFLCRREVFQPVRTAPGNRSLSTYEKMCCEIALDCDYF
jgi:hypothetical protein